MHSKPNLSLYDFLSEDEEDNAQFLINGILPKVGLTVIIGSYGTGKTQLAMRMASSVGAQMLFGEGQRKGDSPVLDFYFPTAQGYALYFVGEDKHYIKSRIKSTKLALSEYERNFLKRPFDGIMPIIPIKVNNPLSFNTSLIEEIHKLIAEARRKLPKLAYRPELIIFDTLSASFAIKDENNNSEMQKLSNELNNIAEHFSCSVVAITHPPKSHDAPAGFSRGASALNNAADVIIELKKINASRLRIMTVLKMRNGPYQGTSAHFQIQENAPVMLPVSPKECSVKPTKETELSTRQQKIIELLKSLGTEGKKQTYIIETLTENFQKENGQSDFSLASLQRAIRREIDKLVELQILHKTGKKKNVMLSIVQDIDLSQIQEQDTTSDSVQNADRDQTTEQNDIREYVSKVFEGVKVEPPPNQN